MKKTKCTVAVLAIVVIMLIAGIGTSIYFALMSYKQMQEVSQYITELQAEPKEEETRENDVKIADSYEIKSTEAISDAYKSKDTSKLSDKERETLDMASDILEEIITDGMTDIEKETAVYDWMCANLGHDSNLLLVIPNGDGDADNPYGVLKYHNAVCVGYATTFRLFMQMMDIECMVVHNTECYHSWDLINLDGDWYHTDIYSDVGRGDYSHFNLCDAIRGQQESWDTEFFPHANSLKYNKAMDNMCEASSLEELPGLYTHNLMDKKYSFFVKFTCPVDEEFARRVQAVTGMYNSAIDSMYIPDQGFWLQNQIWLPYENGYVLWISFYHYGEESEAEYLTDEEKEQLNETIQEVINQLYDSFYNDTSDDDGYVEDDTTEDDSTEDDSTEDDSTEDDSTDDDSDGE